MEKLGVLHSMGSQIVGHNLASEQQLEVSLYGHVAEGEKASRPG